RSGHPTSVALVAGPDSATPTTLVALGPSDYEQFMIEAVDGELDATLPQASWRHTAAFTIRVSAVKRNADANGIVDFAQTVRISYPDGLRRIEWETLVTTQEGVSAVDKARTFGAIDVTHYGSNYWYMTGAGGDGVDLEYSDADELRGRTPTACRAVSTIQECGVDLGTTNAAGSLFSPTYMVNTRRTADEVVTTYTAEARGVNAEAWVMSHKPGGSIADENILREPSARLVRGTWEKRTQRTDPTTGDTSSTQVRVELSGGGPAIDWEIAAGGYEPVLFEGGMQPWQAVVTVSVERTGGGGRLSELRLPGPPGEPWRLVRAESSETFPFKVDGESGADASQTRWRREARLVFRAARPPDKPVSEAIASAPLVASHLDTGQVT